MKCVLLLCAILASAASVRAQVAVPAEAAAPAASVVLCDAEWMDTERVRALLAVEFGAEPVHVVVDACTDIAADVHVRFGAAENPERSSQLDLSQTAHGARSRLVALVIAELVRLGPPDAPTDESTAAEDTPAEDTPEDTAAEGTAASTAQDAAEDTAPAGVQEPESAEDAEAVPDAAAPENAAMESPEQEEDDVEARAEELSPAEAPAGCDGWGAFGRGPCSWAISLSYGAAIHQLGLVGESRAGADFLHQMRLTARWRYLLGGFRVYGNGFQQDGPDGLVGGVTMFVGGVTMFAGLEWWSRRWTKRVLALRTGLEAGIHGVDIRGFCDFGCGQVGEATVGAFTSLRFERGFGPVRGGVDFELGWSRGFRIDRGGDLVTGLGGPWLSVNVDLSIGRRE